MIYHNITRGHYKFYSELAAGVSDETLKNFMRKNRLSLKVVRDKHRVDPFLNNLSYRIFDRHILDAAKNYSQLEELVNACLWKHLLVFRVLGAKPRFTSKLGELYAT